MTEAKESEEENDPAAADHAFDRYQSLVDPSLMIVVAKDVVPPFRFRAGGWELLQSSVEIGSAMKTRIAEKGFFLFRLNADKAGGVELTNLPSPPQNGDSASHGTGSQVNFRAGSKSPNVNGVFLSK